MIDGKNYRTVSDACWDSQRRMDDMDRMGIKTQALSPMPELFNYWMDIDPANDLIHYLNDTIATMASTSGGRFVGLGSVPLQDVDKAIDELRRCMRDLGFSGVEIGSNINGIPIGDPRFLPFSPKLKRWVLRCSSTRSDRPEWTGWSVPDSCSKCWPIRRTSDWQPPLSSRRT